MTKITFLCLSLLACAEQEGVVLGPPGGKGDGSTDATFMGRLEVTNYNDSVTRRPPVAGSLDREDAVHAYVLRGGGFAVDIETRAQRESDFFPRLEGLDTVLTVYPLGSDKPVASNDESGSNDHWARIRSLTLEAGKDYVVMVGAKSEVPAVYSLQVNCASSYCSEQSAPPEQSLPKEGFELLTALHEGTYPLDGCEFRPLWAHGSWVNFVVEVSGPPEREFNMYVAPKSTVGELLGEQVVSFSADPEVEPSAAYLLGQIHVLLARFRSGKLQSVDGFVAGFSEPFKSFHCAAKP